MSPHTQRRGDRATWPATWPAMCSRHGHGLRGCARSLGRMDLVVRTPHGDADLTLVSWSSDTTVADLVEATTGQVAPPLVHIDDRPVDASTPLVDAPILVGSVVSSHPDRELVGTRRSGATPAIDGLRSRYGSCARRRSLSRRARSAAVGRRIGRRSRRTLGVRTPRRAALGRTLTDRAGTRGRRKDVGSPLPLLGSASRSGPVHGCSPSTARPTTRAFDPPPAPSRTGPCSSAGHPD